MSIKLYVGGLAWATNDQSLEAAFAQAGNVLSARVVLERGSDRSRGFGFVEFESQEEADRAIEMFDGKELDGRVINVNIAKDPADRPQGGSFSGASRGGFGGGRPQGGSSFGGSTGGSRY